jgi:hypothetical protein
MWAIIPIFLVLSRGYSLADTAFPPAEPTFVTRENLGLITLNSLF